MREPREDEINAGCSVMRPEAGDPSCRHEWKYPAEVFTTGPYRQHRSCGKCGRRECVAVCDQGKPCWECPGCPCSCHRVAA